MRTLALLGLAVLALGCAARQEQPAKTQLETREFQTRDFDVDDPKLVMKAMLNVLQDEGYAVKNAVVDLGLITASKETDLAPSRTGDADDGFGGIFGTGGVIIGGRNGGILIGGPSEPRSWRKTEVIDVTSNVSERGEQTRVRVSFQRKTLDNRGNPMNTEPIDDAAFYQDFFTKVDKAIFLQREQL